MPSVDTFVVDLRKAAIKRIGKNPNPSGGKEVKLSEKHFVKYMYTDVLVSLDGDKAHFVKAKESEPQNGRFLHYYEAVCAIAELDEEHPIVASGGFTGCAYHVYTTPEKKVVCAHISRPLPDTEKYVKAMEEYAGKKHWTKCVSLVTTGLVKGECNGVWCVSQRVKGAVESVMLLIDKTGGIIGHNDPASFRWPT
jgi:hypothetical protein